MDEYKIVFSGNMGAGKSTAITQLSDIDVVSTDVTNNDERHEKQTTTVGIDYGYIKINDSLKLALYGTPGQERFAFMWKIVAKGALGAIILIDSQNSQALEDLQRYVQFYLGENIKSIVIGITHTDIAGGIPFEQFIQAMQRNALALPLFPCDARKKTDMRFLLEVLIATIEAQYQ